MKVIGITAIIFLAMIQTAFALPHLTCDKYVPGTCQPGTEGCNAQGQKTMPTSFILKFDYATHQDITISPRIDAENRADIWWEIAIPDGVYTIRALACIATDKCSDPSNPVTFTKAIPVLPILKIVEQAGRTFLISDPYTPGSGMGIPDDFQIRKDGSQGTITSVSKIDPTGKIILWYDLTSLPSGTHTFRVSARNMWGGSPETVAFPYTKESPVKPAIKLQK